MHPIIQLTNFKTKHPTLIFVVEQFSDDSFKHIFDTKHVLGYLVKVEIYRFTLQCYNCQKFNHLSEKLSFNYFYVKCAGSYPAKDSPVKHRKYIKCVNCMEIVLQISVVALKTLRIFEIVEFLPSKKTKVISKILKFSQTYILWKNTCILCS